MQKEKKPSKEEIKAMLADEHYSFLLLKKSGKALRKHIHDAENNFINAMSLLEDHA